MERTRDRTLAARQAAVLILGIFLSAAGASADSIPVPLPDAPTDDSMIVEVATEAVQPPPVVSTSVLATPTLLRIVHPPEGARLPPLQTSFVYGSADPGGKLTINKQSVAIHPGGGFLAMIPFSPGAFDIKAELNFATGTVSVVRKVYVASAPATSPVRPLTVEYVKPEGPMEVRPGETVPVLCKGSPGMEASFHIDGVKGKFPMVENAPGTGVMGIYRGSYVVQERDDFKDANVRVTLVDPKSGDKAHRDAPGRLTRLETDSPSVVEVALDTAVLRAGPAFSPGDKLGYVLFPPPGVRLEKVGRRGDELKIRLSDTRFAWISEKEVRALPAGTPAPQTTVGSLAVSARDRSTLVKAPMGQKIPFEVRPAWDGRTVDVSFFGAVSNTDWIRYDSTGGVVGLLEWFQDDGTVYRLRVHTPPDSWWGYDARYEGSTFVLELRSPPPPVQKSTHVLEGLVVLVDPGHSADIGSIGPTGLLEKDANLAISKCLQKKLLAEKAQVVMIREGSEHVGLYDRPKLAWRAKADLLISVHNNALPDGANPFERNGYSVY
jgi:N-acetylmuramoyl-L-alanine amidase